MKVDADKKHVHGPISSVVFGNWRRKSAAEILELCQFADEPATQAPTAPSRHDRLETASKHASHKKSSSPPAAPPVKPLSSRRWYVRAGRHSGLFTFQQMATLYHRGLLETKGAQVREEHGTRWYSPKHFVGTFTFIDELDPPASR